MAVSSPTSSSSSSESLPLPSSSFASLPIMTMKSRHIDKILEDRVTLIVGEPGCGKSSQVPQFLQEANMAPTFCTQPRRFAAVAKMVAESGNSDLAGEIGYHIGHSKILTQGSKILFKTAGVPLDELLDKGLNALKYMVIILDEVHERSVESDLVLVCAKQFLMKNNDLRVVLMSTTADLILEANMAPTLCTQPRRFEVAAVAKMVAESHNSDLGGEIGYHIGHSKILTQGSKILFKTAGVLLDELLDKGLNALKYKVIILDEVHERSVESDLVLVCDKQFLMKNNDLRVVLMSATATTSNLLGWSSFAIPLKLVAVVLFLLVIFSSVLVSAEMISSNSADCPSSSSCSVSIGLKISVTFNVLLLVCCFFRWVALREEIIHHGGMGSEIDSAEDRTNSDLNDSIIDDVEWVEDKLWETNTLESNVNCLVKDLSIPQVEPVKEVKGYKKELVMEADPFMKVEGYEGYEGYEVYEGTLDDRLVAVKKIPLSENSLEIAKNEKTIHYACQDNSSNIMRLYDFDVTTDSFIYIYFQRWECTFGDLIRFCSRETTSSSLHEKQKSYLNKFKEENTLWENSSPSNLLRDLIRQLLVGVADLHSHGILHRNINESSFFIIFNENRITVKLGDLSMGKLRKGKALVELIQFAPKEENNTGGLTDDIFFLGCVVGFSFAHGQHIFKNTFLDPSVLIHNDRAMDIVQQAPEAHYLVQNLIAPHENRLTAERALAQPFFWPCQKKVQFCDLANSRVLGDVLEPSFWDSAKKAAKKVWKGKKWDEKLDGALTDEIANAKDFVRASYHTYDFPDLVRYMRNTLSHCHENSAACKEIVGISQESIFEYFTKKFPQLLVQLHTIVFEHFQTEEDFVFYFTDKGTF